MDRNVITNNVKRLYHLYTRTKYGFQNIKYADGRTYFPELQHKNRMKRKFENFLWGIKYNDPNTFYNLYGFDTIGKNIDEYQDYSHFFSERNRLNNFGCPSSQIAILRDKYLFYIFMSRIGMPVPKVFGVFIQGKVFDIDLNPVNDDYLINKTDYFIKDLDGECASFVKHVKDFEQFEQIRKSGALDKGRYIFQERVVQAESMNAINPNAINTYRIVTVNKGDGKPYLFSGILRVGTSETGNVDNWAAGGLAIGVNEKTGYLQKYGFYKPAYGTKTEVHPDTNVRFSEFKAPQFEEAVKIAIEAHKHLFGIRTIGWDIAITDNGPVFIEGNDNWEISLMQGANGGLKAEWNEAMKD